jgi:outer membrane protein OmpA-like peptidoglycan-associated protein
VRASTEFDDENRLSRWILPALVISLLLHGLLWMWARGFEIKRMSDAYYDKIVPRTFQIERVEIDPRSLEPEPSEEKRTSSAPSEVRLPDDKVAFDSLMADPKAAPSAPMSPAPVLSEKPTVAAPSFSETLRTAQQSGAQSVLEDSRALTEALLDDKPEVGSQTLATLVQPDALTGRAITSAGQLAGGETPGFSNLDSLLAQTGPLSPETAPILMPTDLLFDYDRSDLRPEAVSSLEKLGTLIQRNPQAEFLIEGHTDSFGSDPYNLELSQRRADTVRMWLLGVMRLPPERIAARGFGKSRLIAPASGTIEEQQINRRVEIVIRAPQSQGSIPRAIPVE